MKSRAMFALLLAGFSIVDVQAGEPLGERWGGQQAVLGAPVTTYFNRNNISTVFWSNGFADIDIFDVNAGFVYPKGSGKTAVFKSGMIWGGKVGGEVRVGGSAYRTGLRQGRILAPGVPEDPDLPHVRIYRVRPDYLTGDMTSEVNDEGIGADSVRRNYARDWMAWPAMWGAPFTDVNLDGMYDPWTDIPGVEGADQTIWFVANDLDSSLTFDLYGSRPLGLEIQGTIWGYQMPGVLGNTIFKSYLLINRGLNVIDSMFISQWCDADIGNSTDDYVGCDSVLGLGYAYNVFDSDQGYEPLPPPAAGFDMVQGPLVPAPGDSGVFRGRRVYDRRNLGVTTHYYFTRGDATVTDPQPGSYEGTLQFYNFMRGFVGSTGAPFTDPADGRVTKFALDGDPTTGVGWIDGQIFPPGDRRNGMASGPFAMAPGDTQEIVIAQLAAGATPGIGRLSAIDILRLASAAAQSLHGALFRAFPPLVSAHVTQLPAFEASVQILADSRPGIAQAMTATLVRRNGTAMVSFPLYDDGLHGDGGAGDGIFGSSTTVARDAAALYANLVVTSSSGGVTPWERIVDNITTAGPVLAGSFRVFSDNINNDGQPNPGENVRYGFTIHNADTFTFTGLQVLPFAESSGGWRLDVLPGGATDSMTYDPAVPESYFTLDVPGWYGDTVYQLPVTISSAGANRWQDTLEFRVYALGDSTESIQISRVAGLATGDFTVVTVYPAQIRNHVYVLRGVDDISGSGTPGITLRDSTDGRVILLNHPLPDALGHTVPVTDGFKVLLGTIDTAGRMADWSVPSGGRRWTWTGADGFGLEGFYGAIGNAYAHWFSGSTVTPAQLHHVLIKLAATDSAGNLLNASDTTASLGYRYLRGATMPPARPEFAPFILNPFAGYAFQEFGRAGAPNIPFAAYDLDRGGQRMAIGHLENNQPGGTVDGRYWPPFSNSGRDNVSGAGPREWWFIYDVPYGTTPDPALSVDILNGTTPMMWMGTPNLRGGHFEAGDEFLITAIRPPSSSDVWFFNPTVVLGVEDDAVPVAFALLQNYPNPFNPATSIRYTLPAAARVVLGVYNLLGQKVRDLVEEEQAAGEHLVRWDGMNEARRPVAAGVYFYRIHVRTQDRSEYTMVKKMVLLK